MATIHDEIDNWLAADVHDQLSEEERRAFGNHLVECAVCRKLHQENKIMNKMIEETLLNEKPDLAFEQRMLTGFRNRAPQRAGGIAKLVVDLMRLRATQITAVAALLLGLVQVGRMITNEGAVRGGFVVDAVNERGNNEEDQNTLGRARYGIPAPGKKKAEAKTDVPGRASREAFAKDPQLSGGGMPAEPEIQPEFMEERTAPARPSSVMSVPAARGAAPLADKQEAEKASEGSESFATSRPSPVENRKLIRNAQAELEVVSFEETVGKITAFANEEKGYVATSSSEKQQNGKLRGQVVVKVLPESLDRFLQRIRGLGELKNQTLGTEDVTKAYFDTDSRLKNARVMEQRLIDMLKTKTGKVADLLQVEKELGRVREEIEKMQGELKFWDSQVQFATVTISIAEKDMEEPAAFLLKERAQLALYSPEVERIYNDIKALASPKTQITTAQLDRDYSGRVSARINLLIAPEESDTQISRVKGMGRVENFQVQTERVAQGGTGMSENAKTKRDKVELNITISREEQEQSFQQTSLRIRTSSVDEKSKEPCSLAEKQNGHVRSSSFSRDPNGREFANVSLRVPMKNYSAMMESLNSLGKLENISVQRQDRTGVQVDEANAPADLSIQVYSQGNIVSKETGIIVTMRRTLAQAVAALMWSLRMIGVALAFLAPWVIAILGVAWISRRIIRARRSRLGRFTEPPPVN